MDIQAKIAELMEKEEFRAAFEAVQTPEDVIALFAKEGVEVPADIAAELFAPLNDTEGELSDDDLMQVAGGGKIAALVGSAIGNGVFYGAGYLGGRLAGWSKADSKKYAQSCGKFGSGMGKIIGYLL